MRKPRQFCPTVSESRLEERVVLTASSSLISGSAFFGPSVLPVATSSQVTATLNQLHNSLLSYQNSVTNAVHYAQAEIAAGHVSQATAINLLNGYIGNKTSLLFFQARSAAGSLPYGAGFNGYVNHATTAVGDLPSGSDSLYSLLTFPSATTTGPIASLQNSVFTPLTTGNFNGMLTAVNSAAIHSTYAQIKNVVASYVAHGVTAHDFSYNR